MIVTYTDHCLGTCTHGFVILPSLLQFKDSLCRPLFRDFHPQICNPLQNLYSCLGTFNHVIAILSEFIQLINNSTPLIQKLQVLHPIIIFKSQLDELALLFDQKVHASLVQAPDIPIGVTLQASGPEVRLSDTRGLIRSDPRANRRSLGKALLAEAYVQHRTKTEPKMRRNYTNIRRKMGFIPTFTMHAQVSFSRGSFEQMK